MRDGARVCRPKSEGLMATRDDLNSSHWPTDDEDAVTVELHSIDLTSCNNCSKFIAAYSQRCPYCKQRVAATVNAGRPWFFIATTAALLTLLGAGLIGHYLGM